MPLLTWTCNSCETTTFKCPNSTSHSKSGDDGEMTTSSPGHHREAKVALVTTAKILQLWANNREMRTGKRGHYERGLFTGEVSRISKISKFSRILGNGQILLCFPWSGGSLESRTSKFSGISTVKWGLLRTCNNREMQRPWSDKSETQQPLPKLHEISCRFVAVVLSAFGKSLNKDLILAGVGAYHPGRNYYKITHWNHFFCNTLCTYYIKNSTKGFYLCCCCHWCVPFAREHAKDFAL